MSSKRLTNLSKQLSYYLRHKPENIGLTMDKDGWVEIAQLLQNWPERELTFEDLCEIVDTDSKGRYAIHTPRTTDGPGSPSIRAVQGHSTNAANLKFNAVRPPPVLYHGTTDKYLAAILKEGLTPQRRQYVHLSADIETATQVGSRHGKPVLLQIRASLMYMHGLRFYLADNGVYLADHVPPKFIVEM